MEVVKMSDSIIVKTKVKELAVGYSVSSDFADVLDEKAKQLLKDAMRRAEANGRKTIMSKDL
jgi:histone H3/H4